ncbi:c-type cytochrome [Gallionella capsiferriformans]|jgi:mono/diheme cytochrome c family protein|uniref:Cytochrome c class I n=1 Tax=Gallionella capsiferriformans (strain ES-2) TaxID=395494 RepID=D9SC32_GALCS|nr:c-type cytochrome [Gallionella capsiferriformans]ADL54497.1 cytochrome c class I [Gallionella capsiferriformans ES-2]
MKKLSLAITLLLAPTFAQAWPWSQDMVNQVSIKPQESVDAANPGMAQFPKRSQPVAGTTVNVKDLDAAKKMANPIAADEASVAKGRRLYEIYCTPCHGKSGAGDGLVGTKLPYKPWNLTSSNDVHPWDSKDYPDGYIFGVMSLGLAVMPSYANDLTATERWHVVNYIRKVMQKGPAVTAAAQSK